MHLTNNETPKPYAPPSWSGIIGFTNGFTRKAARVRRPSSTKTSAPTGDPSANDSSNLGTPRPWGEVLRMIQGGISNSGKPEPVTEDGLKKQSHASFGTPKPWAEVLEMIKKGKL